MADGDFTKEEAVRATEAFSLIMRKMPRQLFVSEVASLNTVSLFLRSALLHAPSAAETKPNTKGDKP